MSDEQLSKLLAKLQDDPALTAKLQSAADLETVAQITEEAGFKISKADWLKYQANQVLELNDEELERAAGGCKDMSLTWVSALKPGVLC